MNTPNPTPVTTTAEDAQEVAAVRAPVAVATSDAERAAFEDFREEQPDGTVIDVEPAGREEPPSNSLPDWSECAMRVENSDFIAKRVAEGGHGPDADSKLATELHRFIYEYDDADAYRSAWFLHRLEKLINEVKSQTALPIDFKQATDQGGWLPVGVPRGWRIVPDEEGTTVVSPSGDSCYLWDLDSRHAEAGQVHREVLRQLSQDLLFAPAEGGWQFVPKEPTEDMLLAAEISDPRGYGDLYVVMLRAAPTLLGVADGDAVGGKSGGAA